MVAGSNSWVSVLSPVLVMVTPSIDFSGLFLSCEEDVRSPRFVAPVTSLVAATGPTGPDQCTSQVRSSGARSKVGACSRLREGSDGSSSPARGAHAVARRRHGVAELATVDDRAAARPGRRRGLLDLHLHQLAAHAPVRSRVGTAYRRRAGRHRRAHPRVRHRARRRQRPPCREGDGPRVPDRRRQRLRDLAGVRQPLLAGAVLRRRERRRSAITTSARASTSSPSRSSSSCSTTPGTGVARRPRRRSTPQGIEIAADWDNLVRPRPTSATGAESSSRPRAASHTTSHTLRGARAAPAQPVGARRRVDDRPERPCRRGQRGDQVPLPRSRRAPDPRPRRPPAHQVGSA